MRPAVPYYEDPLSLAVSLRPVAAEEPPTASTRVAALLLRIRHQRHEQGSGGCSKPW